MLVSIKCKLSFGSVARKTSNPLSSLLLNLKPEMFLFSIDHDNSKPFCIWFACRFWGANKLRGQSGSKGFVLLILLQEIPIRNNKNKNNINQVVLKDHWNKSFLGLHTYH